MVKSIYMDAACKMNYASFYILGLKEIYGRIAKFSKIHFQDLKERNQCFLFVVETDGSFFKVAVDFHDSRDLELEILEWCDLYAKINLNDLSYENLEAKLGNNYVKNRSKIISIPPSFGVKIFSFSKVISHIIFLIINFWRNKQLNIYIADVLRMYLKRLPISSYKPEKHTPKYIFFIASIWDKATDFINITRAYFIRACKRNENIKFEGGFVNIGYECDYISDIQNLMFKQEKIPLKSFIKKTKKSVLVFNNPSVHFCHGWKLAEYLCMGKAILSVPLSNKLPVDLIHEQNIYFIGDNEHSIYNSVQYLLKNEELINSLEKNAKIYWQNVASPSAVIKSLLSYSV